MNTWTNEGYMYTELTTKDGTGPKKRQQPQGHRENRLLSPWVGRLNAATSDLLLLSDLPHVGE